MDQSILICGEVNSRWKEECMWILEVGTCLGYLKNTMKASVTGVE